MKYNVMLNILTLLLRRRKITAAEIARRYEISVRSVYRYVEEMIICGVPIDVERGRYGGLTIADTYRLPTGYFTKEEYAVTLNALDALASQINDGNVISAREKLENGKKSERREMSVCGNIIVDGGSWSGSKSFADKMRVCEQAVNDCSALMIEYVSREGERSKRVIEPHVLILKQGVWYVWAFCHTKQDFRTFKIGRIRSATFTGGKFVKREFTRDDVDLDFTYGDEDVVEVTLEIEKTSLADAEEWLGIDNVEPHGNKFYAAVSLPDDDALVNKILSYGGAVKVLSPQSLKERVRAVAAEIAENA